MKIFSFLLYIVQFTCALLHTYVNFTNLCKSEQMNVNTYPSMFTYVQNILLGVTKCYTRMYLRISHHVNAK